MAATDLLCLNRIIKPQIPLEEFLKFTADLCIKYIEGRNGPSLRGNNTLAVNPRLRWPGDLN
jgi:predicted xylose isomerase-like sugar epimerase